jgi:hypothetical protein
MNILKLYPTDFAYVQNWLDICDSLNISHDTEVVYIDYNVALTDDDALNIESKFDRKVNDE